jgi:hypothetical protein
LPQLDAALACLLEKLKDVKACLGDYPDENPQRIPTKDVDFPLWVHLASLESALWEGWCALKSPVVASNHENSAARESDTSLANKFSALEALMTSALNLLKRFPNQNFNKIQHEIKDKN